SGSLLLIQLESPSGRLNGMRNDLPGTTEDFSDAPNFLVYFGVPPTNADHPPRFDQLYDLGSVVTDGGPAGDLALRFWPSLTSDLIPGQVVEIPEPSALVMASVALGIPCLVQRVAG